MGGDPPGTSQSAGASYKINEKVCIFLDVKASGRAVTVQPDLLCKPGSGLPSVNAAHKGTAAGAEPRQRVQPSLSWGSLDIWCAGFTAEQAGLTDAS